MRIVAGQFRFMHQRHEALWPTGFDRHGQATVISCGDEGDRP